jgi:hypothetical protein
VMARVDRVMATATERVMATNGDNSYGKEARGRATVATMGMGMGTVQRTWPLMLQMERGG